MNEKNDPVAEFEKRFAKLIGSEYAIAVNSGTSALHAALEAAEVRYGEVIVPALCPAMVAFAVIHAGAWPVFVDVDPQTQLVTHETIRPALSPRTKAIIAVALHGLPVDIDPIVTLCRNKGIVVIEDCAQCLMGRYKDSNAGTKATFGCYSFERKKHFTTGSEGGIIVTNNANFAMRARKFAGLGYRHMGASGTSTRVPEIHPGYDRFDTIGLNYRLSMAQAEIGLIALKTLQDAVWRRQDIGYLWQHALGCPLQPHRYSAENVFYTAGWDSGLVGEAWLDFHAQFNARGGDGFYAAPQLPWREPALDEYKSLFPTPAADHLQASLMCFKTHYKSLTEAKQQTDILADLLAKVA